jgi:hypothetical protein
MDIYVSPSPAFFLLLLSSSLVNNYTNQKKRVFVLKINYTLFSSLGLGLGLGLGLV